MTQPDFSPSAERNKEPILAVLRGYLADSGTALELASGTGQHVEYFAQQFPQWTWQPTELQRGALYNIEARADAAGLANVLESRLLDVRKEPWFDTQQSFDLLLCINMLHIAPWAACAALMRGAAAYLAPGGHLVTYGPYFETGVSPTQSNIDFDASLRAHDPEWGIRLLSDVEQQAAAAGLHLLARHAMPANNLLLVWKRTR